MSDFNSRIDENRQLKKSKVDWKKEKEKTNENEKHEETGIKIRTRRRKSNTSK